MENGEPKTDSHANRENGSDLSNTTMCTKCVQVLRRIFASPAFHLLLLIVYAAVGAAVFMAVEADHFDRTAAQKRTQQQQQHSSTVQQLAQAASECSAAGNCQQTMNAILTSYEQNMSIDINQTTENPWKSFTDSTLYCVTVFSTIGYGVVACSTVTGRVITIFYALFGIPLTVLLLNGIGQAMDRALSKLRTNVMKKLKRDPNTGVQGVPLIFTLVFLLILLNIMATSVMLFNRHMDYFEAFYFCFISITTIGFGDVMPNMNSTVAVSIMLLFGLSFFPLVINALNAQIEEKLSPRNSNSDNNCVLTETRDDATNTRQRR